MRKLIVPLILVSLLLSLVGCSGPPYYKAPGESVNLIDNSSAFDHTWQEVKSFLERDTTDEEEYTPEHMCGFFAEELHNRAEYYGFKTALVVVEFETGEPHALNAFNTVDYGLVCVDCTGEGRLEIPEPSDTLTEIPSVEHWDKVAYIVEGEKMGFISLGYEEGSFNYSWYKECRVRLADFEASLDSYNNAVLQYENDSAEELARQLDELCLEKLYDVNYIASLPYNSRRFLAVNGVDAWLDWEKQRLIEQAALAPLPEELREQRNYLITEWAQVRGYVWEESDSPIKSIKIYW